MGKGQIFGIDLLLAIVIFYLLFTFVSNARQQVQAEPNVFEQLSLKARVASSFLLGSRGEPFGWVPSNVTSLGIVERRGVISPEKLRRFLNLSVSSPERTSELLSISGLQFYFNLSYLNGSTVTVNGNYFNGSALVGSNFNSTYAASAYTVAVMSGQPVKMQLKVGFQ